MSNCAKVWKQLSFLFSIEDVSIQKRNKYIGKFYQHNNNCDKLQYVIIIHNKD